MKEYQFKYDTECINVIIDGEEYTTIRLNSNGRINKIDCRDFISSIDNIFLNHFMEELGYSREYTKDVVVTVIFEDETKHMPCKLKILKEGVEHTLDELDNGYIINQFIRETIGSRKV